ADPQLFATTPAPQTREDLQARLRARLGEVPPEPVETGFVGRSRELLVLERLLRQERWAVLRGQGGEGKTALAAELARWLVRSRQVRRAAFVSVELYSGGQAVLDALGRQLVGSDYSTAKFDNTEQALQPIERAMKEQATLLLIDNMESVLLPPYLEAPQLLSEEAKEELEEILKLAERLLRAGETRIVFTSREALPAPFTATRQRLELHQLQRGDAVALIERALVSGDGATGGERTLEARREEVEELAEAVQCHARTLALLGPELRRSGVAPTREALVELMEQMEREVAHLPADDPRRREQSLLASVELSLRRLSPDNRERVRVLGVFHGGVDLNVLQVMTGWEQAEVEGLAVELVGTGLATANPYNHLSLNPALCPFLKASLRQEEHTALTARWLEAMTGYLGFLDQQRSQNTALSATLTLLELPNLFALLDLSKATADPESTIYRATALYSLLQGLGKPRLLERLARVRKVAAAALGEGSSHARFEASRNRIEQQLAGGQLQEALAGAQQLLEQARAAGEKAYAEAAYDLAMACWLLGRVLKKAGGAQQALPLLQEAGHRFEAMASDRSNKAAEGMASACLTEQGDCLSDLGQYDAAAAAYEEAIRRDEQRGDQRSLAVGKGQLGTVRLLQERYGDALAAHEEARDTFSRLNELGSVATAWHQIGVVHQEAEQPVLAEQAYNQSLAIKVRLGNQAGQASTLGQLGNLYSAELQRPEEAVAFSQRAAELFRAIGDTAKEGVALNNLANSLRKLKRLEEARDAITRAIQCKELYGHAARPWKSWNILADIETKAGNPAAAGEARQKARFAYLSNRRDGGENQSGSGRLAQDIHQALSTGDPAAATSLLQQLAADPDFANQTPFLTTLQAITAGSRDPSLAEDPGLDYSEAAEVVLLIEALEGGASS
ncbi:MAG: tetratricopeptide repeat protein, partial [Cyanobacteriota bacterium]